VRARARIRAREEPEHRREQAGPERRDDHHGDRGSEAVGSLRSGGLHRERRLALVERVQRSRLDRHQRGGGQRKDPWHRRVQQGQAEHQ
jgi:hypothetical protein